MKWIAGHDYYLHGVPIKSFEIEGKYLSPRVTKEGLFIPIEILGTVGELFIPAELLKQVCREDKE